MDLSSATCEVRGVTKIIRYHPLGAVFRPDFMAIWPVLVEFSCSGLKCWTDGQTGQPTDHSTQTWNGREMKPNLSPHPCSHCLSYELAEEEQRGVREQEEKRGEPGHLSRALSRQLQPLRRWRRLLHQRRDGLGHAQSLQRGEGIHGRNRGVSVLLSK